MDKRIEEIRARWNGDPRSATRQEMEDFAYLLGEVERLEGAVVSKMEIVEIFEALKDEWDVEVFDHDLYHSRIMKIEVAYKALQSQFNAEREKYQNLEEAVLRYGWHENSNCPAWNEHSAGICTCGYSKNPAVKLAMEAREGRFQSDPKQVRKISAEIAAKLREGE